MLRSLPPRSRRLVTSLGYGLLVAFVVGLGYLTFQAVSERRRLRQQDTGAQTDLPPIPLLEIGSFSTRRERTTGTERLSVSFWLRLTAPGTVDCYVYVVARNDHVTPKLWAVWPPQGPSGAVTTGGHFRAHDPSTGQAVQLGPSWSRVVASIDHAPGRPPFDTVTVYVVSPKGETLLSRPFGL